MAHVDNLRRHFPSLRHMTDLNTGTCGPLPDVVIQHMQAVMAKQFEEGRPREAYFGAIGKVKQEIREQLAALFHAQPDEFAITQNTTQSINTVLWGLPLQAGDEIIYMDTLHPGGLLPVTLQKQRRGAVLRCVRGKGSTESILSALKKSFSSRTKLVVVAHVCYQTGHRMPVEDITTMAHEHGALCLVDGAQGAGADVLDLSNANIDFYALPGQKWLCGPDGVGALFVKKGLQATLDLTYAGHATLGHGTHYDPFGWFVPAPGAARYEFATADLLNLSGFLEALKFLRIQVGWDYAYTRIHGLSGQLIDGLLDIPRTTLATPREARAGIISFRTEHTPSKTLVDEAAARNINVRYVPELDMVRVCTGYYNTEDEVQRLLQLVHG